MGFLDKITDAVGDNADKVEGALDKAADLIDDKTGHKHSGQIDTAAEKAKGLVEKLEDKKKD
jgi:ABC-type transporter Mla subunit MlaD